MELYKIWAIIGFVFLFLELGVPSMFFLPLGGAAFFSAIAAFIRPEDYWCQGIVFAIFAGIFLLACRPYIMRKTKKEEKTGIDAKYIGHDAIVVKTIGEENTDGVGKIKIYDEIWQAKSINGECFLEGEVVRIVKNESIVMYVERG